jgi:hypothetical protein
MAEFTLDLDCLMRHGALSMQILSHVSSAGPFQDELVFQWVSRAVRRCQIEGV